MKPKEIIERAMIIGIKESLINVTSAFPQLNNENCFKEYLEKYPNNELINSIKKSCEFTQQQTAKEIYEKLGKIVSACDDSRFYEIEKKLRDLMKELYEDFELKAKFIKRNNEN